MDADSLLHHQNWVKAGLEEKLKTLAARRTLEDLTIGPVLTVRHLLATCDAGPHLSVMSNQFQSELACTCFISSWNLMNTHGGAPAAHKPSSLQATTERMLAHKDRLLAIPGARVAFGGAELAGGQHSIPKMYGAIEPTAVFVPLREILASEDNFRTATTEVFGPFQVWPQKSGVVITARRVSFCRYLDVALVSLLHMIPYILCHRFCPMRLAPFQVITEYKESELDLVLEATERMTEHLTAAVVSNDVRFTQVRALAGICCK